MDLLNTYLDQQGAAVQNVNIVSNANANANANADPNADATGMSGAVVPHGGGESRDVMSAEAPPNEILDEFKARVRNWMEIDNNIKKLQAVKKEQQALKKDLTKQVLEFMAKYNIEDLNTKDGKLRYKVNVTKAPITRSTIRTRMMEMYGKASTVQEMVDYVFSNDEVVQKASLKRLKNSRETRLD